jgi:hypothetical protein
MFELSLIANIPQNTIVLATNSSSDFSWIFFIVILIVSGLILGALFISFSNKPTDWEHLPLTDEFFSGGRLDNISNSIKNSSDQSDFWPIKNQIENLFYEKIRSTRGMTIEEIFEMKNRYPDKLEDIIHDKEISDWIFNVKPEEKKGFFDFLRSDKEEKKQKNLSKFNLILDKMEAWGE